MFGAGFVFKIMTLQSWFIVSVICFIFRVGSEQADNTDWVGEWEIQLRKYQKEKRGEISERTNSR